MVRHELIERCIRIIGYIACILLLHISVEMTWAISHGVPFLSLTPIRIMTLLQPLCDYAPRLYYYGIGTGIAAIIGYMATAYEMYGIGMRRWHISYPSREDMYVYAITTIICAIVMYILSKYI